ncbi:hypothetical protein D3C87_1351090 [compost metagenome]
MAQHNPLDGEADNARRQERRRQRRQQVPVERVGRIGAEQRLHHVGGVGADHQELPVRHVDDADQPIGDGQAQRGQQQHAAKAQAGKQVAEQLGATLLATHLVDGLLRGGAYIGIGLLELARFIALHQRRQLLADLRIAVLAEDADGFQPRVARGVGALRQHGAGPDHVEPGAQAGVGLGLAGRFHGFTRGILGLIGQGVDGLRAHRDVRRLQQQAARGAIDDGPQAVVQRERLEFIGLHGHRLAGDGIDGFAIVLAHHAH